ncbi:MAG: YdeI/OmpD-associated family protein [Chitinophagaceae bacterium]|nr:YdeI/OmpD-associated family protein [Chitinophagaceae bacterium]
MKTTPEFEMPTEFKTVLDGMPELKTTFSGLTPGRQRGYLLYFSSAKQSKTRMERIERYIPKILDNKGLDD